MKRHETTSVRDEQGEQVVGGLTERGAEDREKDGFNGVAGKPGCGALENRGSVSCHRGAACLKEPSKNLPPDINL